MSLVKKISWASIAFSILEIALGICVICMPNETLLTFCYLVASLVIVAGVASIVNFFVYGFDPFGLMKGVSEVALGTIFVLLSPAFASPEIFSSIAGIVMLIAGILKVQNGVDAKRAYVKEWWTYLVYGIILLTFAIVLLCNPFGGQKALLICLGALLLIDAVFDVYVTIAVNTKINRVKEIIKETYNIDEK